MAFSTDTILSLTKVNDEHIIQSPEWYHELKEAINDLIRNDFSQLIQILYQADVSEQKLKSLLNQNTGLDTAAIISNLLLERQLQKIKSKKNFGGDWPEPPPDERW